MRARNVLLFTLLCWSVLAATAWAAAGSGSSGFGGGGGGGGGGGFAGGGGGDSCTGDNCATGGAVVLLIILAVFACFVIPALWGAHRLRAKRRARVRQVELASAEAADEDRAFAA